MENITLELVGCPECQTTAEIVDRFVLESTDGPVEHVKVRCARGHWFMMQAERLATAPRPVAPAREESGRWTPARRFR